MEQVANTINQGNVVIEEIDDEELSEFVNNSLKRKVKLNQIPTVNKENLLLRKPSKGQNQHHEGPVKIKYIQNDTERNKTLCTRRPTLFKKV